MGAADDKKWKKLWESDQLIKCPLPDLKAYLKEVKLPMNGTAETVAKRVSLHLDVKYLDLFVVQDNENMSPFALKPAQLRKIVAQLGMDVTGDVFELQCSLIDYLKKKKQQQGGGKGGNNASGSEGNDEANKGIRIAQEILDNKDDYPAILSTSGIDIIPDSSVAVMRKAYLKLSLMIHPDKLSSTFPGATAAFQCLVTAYERLSQPELYMEEEEEAEKDKKKSISRSNEGCFQTAIFCPRCRAEWGRPDSGVEKFDYNFLMMGLRTYNCALCLCDFGCMTAIHKCPWCKKQFDYHPNDYHRQVSCGNEKCKKLFGFFLHHVSPRVEKEYRDDIRAKQEKRLKEREQLQERAKRAKSRQTEEIGGKGKDKLFILNLLDQCPRCGEEDIECRDGLRLEHLKTCNDQRKLAAYAKRLKLEQEENEKKKAAKEAQEQVQNISSWEFLGGKTTDMWLLSEEQLVAMCKSYNLDSAGSREELIGRVVHFRNALDSKRMLTQGEEGVGAKRGKKSLSRQDLPSNMETLTVAQLKAVCACNGIVTKESTKAGIIKHIEKILEKQEEPYLRITDKAN